MVALVIAVLAVMGMAQTFGTGRALINRFEVSRAALAATQERLEYFKTLPSNAPEFSTTTPHSIPFMHRGTPVGTVRWTVGWYDDPATSSTRDLLKVTVTTQWTEASLSDSMSLTRLFLP
jgi:hypothetical protein